MIKLTKGNLLKSDAEALVNTVNCAGYMGKGIALQFKKTFPENYEAYHKACKQNQVVPGQMFVFEYDDMLNHKTIINFPTKRHWRHNSRGKKRTPIFSSRFLGVLFYFGTMTV